MASTPDRVRDLIQQSRLSQRAFAERVRLDESKLSKSLSGKRRFSSLDLARIAEASGVTVDWLLTGDEPQLAMAARSSGGSAERAVREARRLTALRSDMAFLGFGQQWRPVTVDLERGMWVDQGERLAAAAGRHVEEKGRSVHEHDLAGVIEAVFGVDVAIADLGDDFDGLAVSSEEVKLILVATTSLPWRQRYTLVHELGHVLAGDDHGLHVDQDVYDPARKRDGSEVRANAFAASFLMPAVLLRERVGESGLSQEEFAALACELRVSPSALAFRLQNLRLVDAATGERFRAMTGARAAHLSERGEDFARLLTASRTPRLPQPPIRDTFAAYDQGAATLRPYANLIGADAERLAQALDCGDDLFHAS
ncbi:MAG: helix-turn-helix domain-containing protein [Actinomycetes bacterium]